jgi:hypothetical protein
MAPGLNTPTTSKSGRDGASWLGTRIGFSEKRRTDRLGLLSRHLSVQKTHARRTLTDRRHGLEHSERSISATRSRALDPLVFATLRAHAISVGATKLALCE